MSFCVAAAIEVMGRWANKGLPVSSATTSGQEVLADIFKEYLPRLEIIIERTLEIVLPGHCQSPY
jgi:hypothetical protein